MQILIYKTTNSVRNISIFIALFTIPKVCFSAILGNIMAKYSMKYMMLLSQLGIAGLCFLCVKSRMEIILLVSFFFSCFLQVYKVSLFSYIAEFLEREQLFKGNSYLNFAEAGGIILGPLLSKFFSGGELFSYSVTHCLLYFLSAYCIFCLPNVQSKIVIEKKKKKNISSFLKESIQILCSKKNRSIYSFHGFLSGVTGLQEAILLLFITHIMCRKEEIMGEILSAQGIGMLAGGMLGAILFQQVNLKKTWKILALSSFLFSLSVFAYTIFHDSLGLVLLFIALEGMSVSWIFSSNYTFIQLLNKRKISQAIGLLNGIDGISKLFMVAMAPYFISKFEITHLYFLLSFAFFLVFLRIFSQIIIKHRKYRKEFPSR